MKLSQTAIKVTKQSDSDFIRVVENAVQFGYCLLIESVLEEVDTVLDAIL
jgi:hypothetical protein